VSYRRRIPIRECEGGCGKRRGSWRPFTCLACISADRHPESLRDFRRRLQAEKGGSC
jgi:hypothetical protein